ncbi:MAG: hypothetical protein WD004_05670 [Actinomycetota bacterium]
MYDLSVHCETCAFTFERVGVPNPSALPVSVLRGRLRRGLESLDREVVEAYAEILPEGDYVVSLSDLRPKLVHPLDEDDYFANEGRALFGTEAPFYDLPATPRTPYYRADGERTFNPVGKMWGYNTDEPWPQRAASFVFLAPMNSISSLDPNTLAEYRSSAGRGTAVALSVLDAKAPVVGFDADPDYEVDAHWCWTHYLLDGHHKTRATSLEGDSLSLLSFTALEEGVSTRADVEQLIALLG